MTLTCFKSYDVRGRLGVDIDASVARRIGLGFARVLRPAEVVVGRDVRTSGTESFRPPLSRGCGPKAST